MKLLKNSNEGDISPLLNKKVTLLITKGAIKKGTEAVIDSINIGTPNYYYLKGYPGIIFKSEDLQLISLTIAELRNQVKEKKIEIAEIENKLKICKDLELDEYDEELVKVYNILSIVESKKSKIQKAQAIKEFITK